LFEIGLCVCACVFAVQVNDQRLDDARAYLQSLPKTRHSTAADSVDSSADVSRYDLVTVVITMNRDRPSADTDDDRQPRYNPGYLTQTVARLLQISHGDNAAEFHRRKLLLCSVDPQPQTFTELQRLSDFVQTISRYQTAQQWSDTDMENKFEKEKDDYAYCLRAASRFPSPYYMVLEDDVLVDKNAVETVNFVMNYFDLFSAEDWSFLKLYYPKKWSGYGRSWQTAAELGGNSVLGGCFSGGVMLLLRRCRTRPSNCRNLSARLWFAAGAVLTALLCVGIGRQYVESWREYLVSTHRLEEAPGCCTQAVLFPGGVISDLCTHLRRVHSDMQSAVDIAVDGFAHVHGLKRYLIQPNVAEHIGFLSSLHRTSTRVEQFL